MSELTVEQRILIAMRKTLGAVIRDVTPPAGMRHPFSEETMEDVRQCLALISAREKELADAHYTSQYNPPRKAFDFYTAAALVHFMSSKDLRGLPQSRLFYSAEYGLSLVGKSETWEATLESYVSRIDTKVDPGDSDFIKTKKEYFQREISVMRTIQDLPHLLVLLLTSPCLS